MTKLSRPITLLLLWAALGLAQAAPPERPPLEILDKAGEADVYYGTNGTITAIATNGVVVKYGDTILSANRVSIDGRTGDILADGSVRLERNDQTWISEHLHYNYETRQMDGAQFRTGKAPVFAAGESAHGGQAGNRTNAVYTATNGFITSEDYARPLFRVRAREIKVVPGQYFEARDATLYAGDTPIFYFPYYRRDLTGNPNNFSFLPGYRSQFGPYLLTSYNWFLNEQLSGAVHVDMREKRGVGVGPDFDYHLGRFGQGTFRYYYTHDEQPGLDPFIGTPIPKDRERVYFTYEATLATNLTVKSQVAYQRDPYVVRDFFESEYGKDIEPNTFVEANQAWQNWSLDGMAQPRVNPFFETVERLPDVRLSGFRQQIGGTPLYYESASSVGYFRHLFSDTNLAQGDFSASRADTFHQITLPETFFGWLNVTPRAGERLTYYSAASGPGAASVEHYRDVFNTGAEVSFKASRVWNGVQNHFWDVDGLRHIMEPSINYVYIPRPNVLPAQLPQFDYEQTNSLRLLPLDFPDYDAIDSINRQNTIRFGLNNRLQTKRNGEIDNLASWAVYTDWHLRPRSDQTTFSDIYSDLTVKPRTWLSFDSQTRYDIANGQFNLAQHRITWQPNDTWNWTVGHFYLRTNSLWGIGDNLYTSAFFYRLNEDWGARLAHYFDANTGRLQEQDYSIYRDLRSLTVALTFRALDNLTQGREYAVALTFSFKAFPRFGVGQDTVNAASLVGY